jgi:Fe-S-cluster-containing hydrogenase component 2/CRP-like cAMP-binding protein
VIPGSVASWSDLPFVQAAKPEVREILRTALQEVWFEDTQTILALGQYTDKAYLIAEGAVELSYALPAPDRRAMVAKPRGWFGRTASRKAVASVPGGEELPADATDAWGLSAGDIFGETSALSRYPSPFTARAIGRTRCWRIPAPVLRGVLDEPECAEFQALYDRRYEERAIASVLRRAGVFKSVPSQILVSLRDRVKLVKAKPKKNIAREGEAMEGLFVIRAGYVKVLANTDGAETVVTYLRPGDVAGGLPEVLGDTWPFSLVALEHVELIKIQNDDVETLRDASGELDGVLMTLAAQRLKERGRALRQPGEAALLATAMERGLLHGKSVLLIDLTLCTRCDDCVRACADTHAGVPRFVREGPRLGQFEVPAACFHCADPVCLTGCPTGAISRPLGTLEVIVNEATCVGCGNCSERCPWGNIQSIPYDSPTIGKRIDLAVKCDLCAGRDAGPACVQLCPHGAAFRINGKTDDLDRVLGDVS